VRHSGVLSTTSTPDYACPILIPSETVLWGGDGENMGHCEFYHNIVKTSSARFHVEPIDTRVGMVQAKTSELSKVFCCGKWLAGSGDLVNKWIVKGDRVRAMRSMLKGLSVAERAMSLVLLWPSAQSDMDVRNRDMVPTGALGFQGICA